MAGQSLKELLVKAGAVLKRQNKHSVYELANGKTFVSSATPSDHRAEKNAISDLRRVADLPREQSEPREPRERRKRPRGVRQPQIIGSYTPYPHRPGLNEALAKAAIESDDEDAFEIYMMGMFPDVRKL